ncbi:hypothetical protein [Candidatus Halocynthiibacter alkanivorans]|uniref:hypothetical protein n=1 Tax=Candidatus Halocynthiibacter alkanivorans TaxID=2267619 RepID=UPI00109D2B86|nr:hypothetical protein [Candidatus Halocynthiibacter alkanivorans]
MSNFLAVGFITASPHHRITASVLVHEFLQAGDEKRLLLLQKQLAIRMTCRPGLTAWVAKTFLPGGPDHLHRLQ